MATINQAGTVVCPKCGTTATLGKKFCAKCGGPLPATVAPVAPVAPARPAAAAAAATPARPASAAPGAAPTIAAIARVGGKGLGIWWLIIPTAVFAFLSREPVPIAIVVATGIGLWWARTQTIPATASPQVRALQPLVGSAPILQTAVVFVMLGGSVVVVALLTALVAAMIRYHQEFIGALEPWWQLQASIPPHFRKPLAFVVPAITGYYFGVNAGGQEWTYTLISVFVGIVIAFLLLFTPPDSMRRKHPA